MKKSIVYAITIAIFFINYIICSKWIIDIQHMFGLNWWIYIVYSVAIIPGTINAFIVSSCLFKKQIKHEEIHYNETIWVMIPSYNEGIKLWKTIDSVLDSDYKNLKVIVINDGSSDNTDELMERYKDKITYIKMEKNSGKSEALNQAFKTEANSELIITVDADTILKPNWITELLKVYFQPCKNNRKIVGVAGNIQSKHPETFIQKLQFFDYLISIFGVKMFQSELNGVSVCQGAFSLYESDVVKGWANVVGEDIVLSWGVMTNRKHYLKFAEKAIAYTTTPDTISGFMKQRIRWARGWIEAIKQYPKILITPRENIFNTATVIAFPLMDFAFLTFMIPHLLIAIFTFKANPLVGLYTLFVLPFGMIINLIIARISNNELNHDLKLTDILYYILFCSLYSLFNQVASLIGVVVEISGGEKVWHK